MTSDLDVYLREAGSDLHLDTPLTDVLSRGARIRRRHQRARIAGAGTVLAATAGVVALALPPGSSPIPAAEAGWGPAMVNLSDAAMAEAEAECRSGLKGMNPRTPAEVEPLAADSRGGSTILVFRFNEVVNTCSLATYPEGRAAFMSSGHAWDLAAGHHFEVLTGGGTFPTQSAQDGEEGLALDGPVTDGVRVLRVSDDVAQLVLHVAGRDIEARVGDGLAVSWVPDGTLLSELNDATATAYATDGSVLEEGPAGAIS